MPYKIIATSDNHSLNCYYLESVLFPWIDTKTRNDKDGEYENIVLLSNPWNIDDKLLRHLKRGGICIVDGLWEQWVDAIDQLSMYRDQLLILTAGDHRNKILDFETISVPNWFWYNECLWYHSRNYHTYQPKIKLDRKHSFFMPIRKSKHWRDMLVKKLDYLLQDAVWSYVNKGRILPGCPKGEEDDQRYLNPEWYDETWYSLVVESTQGSFVRFAQGRKYDVWFMTEKTFKPLAYYHPFLIFGQMGILDRLRLIGFETFPELFDESYDLESDIERRMELIIDQIKSFSHESISQKIVQEKLQHNHNRFFDRELVLDCIQKELIEPLLGFLERKII